jgi:hypothetical protein
MWVDNSRCLVCEGNGRSLNYKDLVRFYEEQGCKLIYTEKEHKGNVTINKVPYICPEGHIIKNLTKNTFNNRINLNLGPCKECRENGRNRKAEQKKSKITCMERYGVPFVSQHKPIFLKQRIGSLKRKEYTFPSGKINFVQGYEPRCLDILLNFYEEYDIDLDNIPTVKYINPVKNKESVYHPDIYIPKDNLLIEVKSTYWLKKELIRNEAKFKACVNSGYSLALYLFDEKELLYIKTYNSDGTLTMCHGIPAKLIFPWDEGYEEACRIEDEAKKNKLISNE